ncbi:MAG: endonuclease/exonuclease/phosphatase family protein [Nitrososphaerales archaeon]
MILKVLQYNILADCCAKGFPACPEEYLCWEYRSDLLAKQLIAYQADVICLQEVDHPSFFLDLLKDSHHGLLIDDNMLFYSRRLSLDRVEYLRYFAGKSAIIAYLRGGDSRCVVATTHLKAKAPFERVRKEQMKGLLDNLNDDLPVIIAGDLNTEPDGAVIPLLSKAGYENAYEPEFTTYKHREDGIQFRTIDYLWSRGAKLLRTTMLPSKDLFPQGLPCSIQPSDHLPLCATYFL